MAIRTSDAPGQTPSDAAFFRSVRFWSRWDAIRLPSWRNALAAVLVAAMAAIGCAYAVLQSPARYLSSAVLVIDSPTELATSASDGPINKLNQLRGKYASLASTVLILGPAAERLGLPIGVVAGASTTAAAPKSLLMVSAATTNNPAKSQEIAQAVAEEIVDYVKQEHVRNNVPEAQRFTFTVVSPAYPGVKTSPTRSRALLVGAGAGFVVLVGAYVAIQLATARRRHIV